MNNRLYILKKLTAAICVCVAPIALGATFPLSSNDWSNPEFQERFRGSYNIDTEVNPSITSEEKKVFDEMIPMLNNDQTEAAISRLDGYITEQTNAAFDFIYANLHYQTGEMETAIQYYETAIKKFPNYYRAYLNLGRSYVNSSKFEEALPHLLKALAIKPGDGNLYGLIGYCYMNEDSYASSLDAYRQAIMLDVKNKDWKMGKLNCLISLGESNEAIALLYEMLKDAPNNAELWQLQANQFLNTDQLDLAAANLEIISEMDASNSSSLSLLGDIYINMEMPEQALRIYSMSLDKGIDISKAIKIATSLSNLGNFDECKEFVGKLKAAYSSEFSEEEELDVLNLEAQVALGLDENKEAAEILEQVVDKDPMNGRALMLLSDYFVREGELSKAFFYAENAAKISEFEHGALLKMAQIKVKEREYQDAATYLRQAQGIKFQDYVADYLVKVESAAQRTL
ncbi:tetratricopeptide repeat protein [Puniceicoccaceae bacterium K14]|nr:tetratricopeptide repeat protein [Puniceicoccaceae bacterium K14]